MAAACVLLFWGVGCLALLLIGAGLDTADARQWARRCECIAADTRAAHGTILDVLANLYALACGHGGLLRDDARRTIEEAVRNAPRGLRMGPPRYRKHYEMNADRLNFVVTLPQMNVGCMIDSIDMVRLEAPIAAKMITRNMIAQLEPELERELLQTFSAKASAA